MTILFFILSIAGICLIAGGIIISLTDAFEVSPIWVGMLFCGYFLLCVGLAVGLIFK